MASGLRSKSSSSSSSSSTSITHKAEENDANGIKSIIESFKDDFTTKMTTQINNALLNLENTLIKKIGDLEKRIEDQDDYIADLESRLVEQNQYVRRNNIEIGGIPKNISDSDLEGKMIKLCNLFDKSLTSKDIEACHWLGKKQNRVIMRFVNRKHCVKLLANRKKLIDFDLNFLKENIETNGEGNDKIKVFFMENLCPEYQFLWHKCNSLYKAGMIHSFWTYNGIVRYKERDDSPPVKVYSLSSLTDYFPSFSF